MSETMLTIMMVFCRDPHTQHSITQWALGLVNQLHHKSLQDLSSIYNGWHFNALNASVDQINDFHIEDMAQHLQESAPDLWNTVNTLLSLECKSTTADPNLTRTDAEINVDDNQQEAQFWKDFDHPDAPDDANPTVTALPHPWHQWKRLKHCEVIHKVVSENWHLICTHRLIAN